MDSVPNNDKAPPPTPAPSGALPGAPQHTGPEKQKYDGKIEKLYKELDDKVTPTSGAGRRGRRCLLGPCSHPVQKRNPVAFLRK